MKDKQRIALEKAVAVEVMGYGLGPTPRYTRLTEVAGVVLKMIEKGYLFRFESAGKKAIDGGKYVASFAPVTTEGTAYWHWIMAPKMGEAVCLAALSAVRKGKP